MKLSPVDINLQDFPSQLRPYLDGAQVFDSSSSEDAKVLFSNKYGGVFIKIAQHGSLKTESEMTGYFHSRGISPQALEYISLDKDYLITKKADGDDCIHQKYLDYPKKLCDVFAENLRLLHCLDYKDCPIKNRTDDYLKTAERNYKAGHCDKTFLKESGYSSPDDAWNFVQSKKRLLKTDTLLHGDYCLPNVILDDWKFSAFIDVGFGGVGDRHIDIFWGIWTLKYNLHTNDYAKRFIDAYGKDNVDFDLLKLIDTIEIFG